MYSFYSNAETLSRSQPEHEIHAERARQYAEALQKQMLNIEYDSQQCKLCVTWGMSEHKESNDLGEYILKIGEDNSIIGLEIKNMVM